ncbi:hypothetical protein EYF80_026358 [Liparis tanakae]|uniref:Uncharacterized protein n=1 Tax=Liparis tanakae TaxID=230148 RepID=A0A4Z2HF39_9TELE|nr:hypothetical protein EYF80_026358 [Liparis tanakae]
MQRDFGAEGAAPRWEGGSIMMDTRKGKESALLFLYLPVDFPPSLVTLQLLPIHNQRTEPAATLRHRITACITSGREELKSRSHLARLGGDGLWHTFKLLLQVLGVAQNLILQGEASFHHSIQTVAGPGPSGTAAGGGRSTAQLLLKFNNLTFNKPDQSVIKCRYDVAVLDKPVPTLLAEGLGSFKVYLVTVTVTLVNGRTPERKTKQHDGF